MHSDVHSVIVIAKIWKQSKCSPMYYTHTHINRVLFSHKNGIFPFAATQTWSILCKVKCQSEKDKYCMILCIFGT